MFQFALDLERFRDLAEDQIKAVVQKTALDIVSRIIHRTPVDHGVARGGWTVALNIEPDGPTDRADPSGSATISAAEAEILRAEQGDSIVIVNNVSYAWALEEGHSTQAPHGMVSLTLAEFPQIVATQSQK